MNGVGKYYFSSDDNLTEKDALSSRCNPQNRSDTNLDTQIKVALIGLSKRSIQALVGIFKQRCGGRFVLSMPAAAHVAVFNMDCVNAKQAWRTFRHKHPESPVVIIAREPPSVPDVEYVPVPISVQALEEALERAAAERKITSRGKRSATSTRPTRITRTGSRPVVVPQMVKRPGAARVRPAIKQDVHFRPGDYLFGRFRHALSTHTGKAVQLRHGEILLTADASHSTVYSNFPQARLWAAAAAQIPDAAAATELTVLKNLDPKALPGAAHVYEHALDRLMWDLAVAAAQGRVAEGTPLDTPVYLRRWPNFTRLAAFDDAMRITAVWVHQPRSLLNLYETLEVPVENVLTLYTAAEAIGLAGNAKREADTLIAPAVVTPSPYGNLIGAVLNRFVRADKADNAA